MKLLIDRVSCVHKSLKIAGQVGNAVMHDPAYLQ